MDRSVGRVVIVAVVLWLVLPACADLDYGPAERRNRNRLLITTQGKCAGEKVDIIIRDRDAPPVERDGIVWDNGVGRVVKKNFLRVPPTVKVAIYLGPYDSFKPYNRIKTAETDDEGRVSFVPKNSGVYGIFASRHSKNSRYFDETSTVTVEDCSEEVGEAGFEMPPKRVVSTPTTVREAMKRVNGKPRVAIKKEEVEGKASAPVSPSQAAEKPVAKTQTVVVQKEIVHEDVLLPILILFSSLVLAITILSR